MGSSVARTAILSTLAMATAVACKSPHESKRELAPEATKPTPSAAVEAGWDAGTATGDPMFPTQTNAGTKQIFFLEEPDRGRHITEAALPAHATLTWSRHAHCELEPTGMVCTEKKPAAGADHWRVGRKKGVTLAEGWRGATRSGRVLLRRNDAGALTEVIVFRGDDGVDWARSYEEPGVRYAERARTGANQLDGCGFMKIDKGGDGHAARLTCLQWLLEPMHDTRGVATTVMKRDATGFVIEERRMDPKNAPLAGHDGVFRIDIERDAAGREVLRRFYDAAGAPVASSRGGCSREATAYDARGRKREWRCLDAGGKPVTTRPDAIRRTAYDARGCKHRQQTFDARSAPSAVDGMHATTWRSDARCQPLVQRCLDIKGAGAACGPGQPAEIRYKRNHAGHVVSARHYDATGKPAGDGEMGVFELRYAFDDKGNPVEQSCWNEDGAPIECSRTGYHASVGSYDHVGRRVRTRFLDTQRKPSSNIGTVIRRDTYDNYDHLYTTESQNAGGKTLEILGAARRTYLYDAGHRLFGMVLYDHAGKPARYRGCFTGRTCPGMPWHAMRVVRDTSGRAVRNLYFDHERMLVHAYECNRAQCWGRDD